MINKEFSANTEPSLSDLVASNTASYYDERLMHIIGQIEAGIWAASDAGEWGMVYDYSLYHISDNGLEYIWRMYKKWQFAINFDKVNKVINISW